LLSSKGFDAIREVDGRSGSQVRVQCHNTNGDVIIECTDVLVAAGRTPNTQGIGLDVTGVELDKQGYIKVDARLETTAPNVWAMGECAGSPQFTHMAFDDFRIVRDNLNGGNRTTKDRLIPLCIFTDPELTRVGLNETEAKSRGLEYRVAKMPMAAVLRTRTLSGPLGFLPTRNRISVSSGSACKRNGSCAPRILSAVSKRARQLTKIPGGLLCQLR
jgi:pyruvate/2-oxoglutarate dehydrogenase complex dihydrolipoamide dehydrogenase (E3) component